MNQHFDLERLKDDKRWFTDIRVDSLEFTKMTKVFNLYILFEKHLDDKGKSDKIKLWLF